jgi:hypothetical protein
MNKKSLGTKPHELKLSGLNRMRKVQPGELLTLSSLSKIGFKIERMTLAGKGASNFGIVGLWVDGFDQINMSASASKFLGRRIIPGELCTGAIGVSIQCDHVRPQAGVSVQLINTSEYPQNIPSVTFYGIALRGKPASLRAAKRRSSSSHQKSLRR